MLRNQKFSGKRGLALWAVLLCGIWLVVLPWLAANSPLKARIRHLDDCGVDAGAMYYTELEMMKPILERLNRRERSNSVTADVIRVN
jgi:hypothetical protein